MPRRQRSSSINRVPRNAHNDDDADDLLSASPASRSNRNTTTSSHSRNNNNNHNNGSLEGTGSGSTAAMHLHSSSTLTQNDHRHNQRHGNNLNNHHGMSLMHPTPPAAATLAVAVDGRDPSPAAGLPPSFTASTAQRGSNQSTSMMMMLDSSEISSNTDDDDDDDHHEHADYVRDRHHKRQQQRQQHDTKVAPPFFGRGDWIKINVGGSVILTQKATLMSSEPAASSSSSPNSFFYNNNGEGNSIHHHHLLAQLASRNFEGCPRDENGLVFLDRDPRIFRHVLNHLRGYMPTCNQSDASLVAEEAAFFGLPELGRAIGAGPTTSLPLAAASTVPRFKCSSPWSSQAKVHDQQTQQQQQQTSLASFIDSKTVPNRFFAGPGVSSDGLVLSSTLIVAATCRPMPYRSGTHRILYKIEKCGDCLAFGVASSKVLDQTGGGPHSTATTTVIMHGAASGAEPKNEHQQQQQQQQQGQLCAFSGQIRNTETDASEIGNRLTDMPNIRRSTFIGKPVSVAMLHSGDIVRCFDDCGEENDTIVLRPEQNSPLQPPSFFLKDGDFVEVALTYPPRTMVQLLSASDDQSNNNNKSNCNGGSIMAAAGINKSRAGPFITFSKLTPLPPGAAAVATATATAGTSRTASVAGGMNTTSLAYNHNSRVQQQQQHPLVSETARFLSAFTMMADQMRNAPVVGGLPSVAAAAAAAAPPTVFATNPASASATHHQHPVSGALMEKRVLYSTHTPLHATENVDFHFAVVMGGNASVSIDSGSSTPSQESGV